MRTPRLLQILVVVFVAALGASGCKGTCQELSEKLCDCTENSVAKSECVRDVSSRESFASPSSEDEAVCEKLIDGCDCKNIDTAEGKRACGLAR